MTQIQTLTRVHALAGHPLVRRLCRFGVSGLITTAFAYALFMGFLALGLHYLVANSLTWVFSVCLGFALNRRFTFGFQGRENIGRHFALFMTGAGLQFALGSAVYVVLIGWLALAPTPAFAINLVIGTSFSFAFSSLATFRR